MKQKNVILMVVAVGCGLVAAFLTSQMSAKGQSEQVDVIVAAKDLPVGTTITKDDLDKCVKIKKMPKDGLPPAYVMNMEELVDKRLSRPLRAEETFNPQDLLKGGAITLPPGFGMVSLPVGVGQAAAGFIGPGSRVDVLATVRLSNQLKAFPLLVNMLVVAVNTETSYQSGSNGVFPNMSMVSFAVRDKEALLLSLAKSRGCTLELLLRHPETSKKDENNDDKIDAVIKLLQDEKSGDKARIIGGETGDGSNPPVEPIQPVAPVKPPEPPPAQLVKVLVAKQDIEPNTHITNDLIAESFEWKDLPKEFATDALVETNYDQALGKAFKTGVSKGQWITGSMVGIQTPKATPRDPFSVPKGSEPDPVKPPEPKAVVKPKTLDVAMHTASGTIIHRYIETPTGEWRLLAQLTPEQAARPSQPEKPKAPEATPGAKILD